MTKINSKKFIIKCKILCVDDEQVILDALTRLFRHVGYQHVLTAHSGELGLGILESNQDTDVIIADEKMGTGMSGNQFLKESIGISSDIVRIQLMADPDTSTLIKAVNEAQIYRHVSKPWNNKELLKIVQEGLKSRLLKRKETEKTAKMTRAAKFYKTESIRLKQENYELKENVDRLQESIGQTASKVNESFLHTLLFTMQYADRNLWLHSRRVGKWCRLMADKLVLEGYSSKSYPSDMLEMAGILHDIGKLKLSEDLNRTPISQLNDDQKDRISKHIPDGLWLIRRLPEEVRKVLRLPIRHHHERRDGNGLYRLFLDQINEWAQIIAITSDYDNFRFSEIHDGPKSSSEVIEKMEEDVYSPSEQIGKYNERFFKFFVELTETTPDRDLERNTAIELPSIAEVKSGQILAEDIYTIKDLFFLARGRTIEGKHIEKMKLYEEQENGVRHIWVEDKGDQTVDSY